MITGGDSASRYRNFGTRAAFSGHSRPALNVRRMELRSPKLKQLMRANVPAKDGKSDEA